MAALENDKLKEEEEKGGFEPGDNADTFYLETQDEYPGDLPDFNEKEEEDIAEQVVSDDAPEPEVDNIGQDEGSDGFSSDAPKIETPEDGSVWDLFEGEEQAQANQGKVEQEDAGAETESIDATDAEDDDLLAMAEDVIAENDDSAQIKEQPEEDAVPEGEPEQIAEDVVEAAEEIEEPEIEEEIEPEAEEPAVEDEADELNEDEGDTDSGNLMDEPIEVDENLKSLIEGELDRSKERKANRSDRIKGYEAAKNEMTDDEMSEKLKEFKAVEDEDGASSIDLSKIKAEHPSTYEINNKDIEIDGLEVLDDPEEEPPAPKKEKKQEAPKSPKSVDETVEELLDEPVTEKKKKKKKKKKAVIIPWTKIATAAASIALIGMLSYGGYHIVDNTGMFAVAPADTIRHETEEAQVHEAKEEHEDIASHDEHAADTHSDSSHEEIEADQEDSHIDSSEIEEEAPAEEETLASHEEIETHEPKEANIPTKKVKKTRQKKTYASRSNTKRHKETRKRPSNMKRRKASSKRGVYTVEIYSSPSRDDAEEWLARLKKRNVKNAFIVTHKKRNEYWYKVRFGSFKSREDAKDQAKKLGYSQSWVDRVK